MKKIVLAGLLSLLVVGTAWAQHVRFDHTIPMDGGATMNVRVIVPGIGEHWVLPGILADKLNNQGFSLDARSGTRQVATHLFDMREWIGLSRYETASHITVVTFESAGGTVALVGLSNRQNVVWRLDRPL